MSREELIAIIVVAVLGFGSLMGYQYMKKLETKQMIIAGMEQCKENPTAFSSELIWVKDCTKYMDSYSKNTKD